MPGKSSDALTLIRRLQALDAALASLDGLHIPSAASEHGVSAKTIQRDLALLRELGHGTVQSRTQGPGGNVGAAHHHRYGPDVPRLFGPGRKSGQYGRTRVYDRELMRQMASAGYTAARIARALGCSAALACQVCGPLLRGSRKKHSLKSDYPRMLEMADAGRSASQIAAEIGCGKALVYRVCAGRLRPTREWARKLDHAAICKMANEGMTASGIAVAAKCSVSHVARILSRYGITPATGSRGRPKKIP